MITLQSRNFEFNFYVKDNMDSPVTGLTYTDFVITLKRQGDTIFTPKVLTASNLFEIGDGWYVVKWDSLDTSRLGEVLFKVEPDGLTPFFEKFSVLPNPLNSIITPSLCIVTGNIVELGGSFSQEPKISFTGIKSPYISGDSFVKASRIETTPDAYGNFSIALLRNIEVRVIIELSGVNHKIVIPDQETVELKDLLPIP